jgi:hypothetical protein
MVIISTSAVEVSIQAVSPVSSLGFSSAASASAGSSSVPAAQDRRAANEANESSVFPQKRSQCVGA